MKLIYFRNFSISDFIMLRMRLCVITVTVLAIYFRTSTCDIEINECGDPPLLSNADIVSGNQPTYTTGDVVTYACDAGYAPVGSVHTAECFFSERIQYPEWTEPDFTCTQIAEVHKNDDLPGNETWVEYDDNRDPILALPTEVEHAGSNANRELEGVDSHNEENSETTTTGVLVKSTEVFKKGKKGVDSHNEENSGTTTTGVLVKSTEVFKKGKKEDNECVEPPKIANSKIVGEKQITFIVGDTVTYACEFGFATVGLIRTAQCIFSERTRQPEWKEPDITCTPRSCGDPGFVVNGHRIGSLFTFPNRVSFECDEGYKLRGNSIRYCQTSGKWSGTLPTCETIICDPPQKPPNGRVSYSSLEYGSKLQYACDSGFLLKSPQTRVCSSNSTWSGDEPTCQEAGCSPPVTPEHGFVQVVGGKSSVDSMALYTCEGERVLFGSATSKCLDIGEWTFPTPKCLEPCSLPFVSHGKIGRYVRTYRGRKQFQELPVGSRFKDGEELYLTCEPNYEPLGKANLEENVVCRGGAWTNTPRCEPAQCRNSPPATVNGRLNSIDRNHGGNVVYYCNIPIFRKAAIGNITCHFGNWIGITPVCKDTRCNIKKLAFPGIQSQWKEYFQSGEKFTVSCEKGYSQVQPNSQLFCNGGSWKGHFPPCIPANCSDDPPLIRNGEVDYFSRLHSSVVTYKCDEFFKLIDDGNKVQCLFGEWTVRSPICKDSRCYSKDLVQRAGTILTGESIMYSGEFLPVTCADGFTSNGIEPFCNEGTWTEPEVPCLESDCTVSPINKGKLTVKVTKRKYNFLRVRFDSWEEYQEVKTNENKQPGSTLYTSCDSGYSFQGKGTNNVLVKCTRGKWYPTPVCLTLGTPYRDEDKSPATDKRELDSKPTLRSTIRPAHQHTRQPPSLTSENTLFETKSAKKPSEDKSNPDLNCFCEYQNTDANLIAHTGSEILKLGAKVKNNCSVKFHCRTVGYYRLQGPAEITCRDCRTWHFSEYPDCVMPGVGDAVLIFDESKTVLPGGSISLKQGETIRITCIANGITNYPEWKTPNAPNIQLQRVLNDQFGGWLYQSVLKLKFANPAHSGKYECNVRGYRAHAVNIQVESDTVVKCPQLVESEGLLIQYDNEQAINSSAIFTCREKNKKLLGSGVLTCLSNGQWSDHPPVCMPSCRELKESEGMAITYSKGVDVDSIATFHCFSPRRRSGVSRTHCKRNGEWADPLPNCTLPFCNLDDLFLVVPEGIVPVMDDVSGDSLPYNFTLRLFCDAGNLRLMGSDTATCGKDGIWMVSQVQCVPGCPALQTESALGLTVEPSKPFYRIGEFITLSCAPGQMLSTELVRLMCLSNGWSENEIPQCIEGHSEETTLSQ